MAKLDLTKYGITGVKEIVHNPSYEQLFEEEMKADLTGFEKGKLTELDAVNVMTGVFTGRSPKDKFIVMDENSKDTVWWTSDAYPNDNHPASQETWEELKKIAKKELSDKRLFVVDAFCGANKNTRMAVRFIVEVAWQAHFVSNMFILPSKEELENFEPDFVVYNASKAKVENYKELGLHSETAVAFNITSREQVIINTWYGGEMKKGMFSMMNYYLPLKGIAAMHCSANTDLEGKNTAIFFGLSGTGKTTLSTDPKRLLIGDDEHGWDDNGVFNFEGGCYAKAIRISSATEPQIYNAIRFGSICENVIVDNATRKPDYFDGTLTENTRVAYPIDFIDNAQVMGQGRYPNVIIFLTCDSFGVLPPISRLDKNGAMYHFLSGFTSKVAGTERGVDEPQPTFSTLFGEPFMPLSPLLYADMFGKKIDKAGTRVYLINTGWTGGPYGVGMRMDLASTRLMVSAALNGSVEEAEFVHDPVFNVDVPQHIEGVDSRVLNPRGTWADKAAYDGVARQLASMFVENAREKYPDMDPAVRAAGPNPA